MNSELDCEIDDNENSCPICFNKIQKKDLCITECNHTFCKGCIDTWWDKKKLPICPMCRNNIKYFLYKGINNRLIVRNPSISVIRPANAITRHPNSIININKNFFFIMNAALTISLISNLFMLGYYADECR